MKRIQVLLVVTALLIASCGQDSSPGEETATHAPTDAPETPTDAPTTEAPETPAPQVADDCPEGFRLHDDGFCHPDEETALDEAETADENTKAGDDTGETPDEDIADEPAEEPSVGQSKTENGEQPTDDVVEAADPNTPAEEGESSAGEKLTEEDPMEDQTGQAEAPADTDEGATEPVVVPVSLVIYEGITSEERCLVAGADWDNGQCVATLFDDPEDAAEYITYWRPTMMDDAYQSVDPSAVDADHWDEHSLGGPWGFYKYHVFYHYNDLEDPQVQYDTMREAASHAVLAVYQYLTDWVWFPHRYDISWTDNPGVLAITGTYPLGEQRTLLLNADPAQRTSSPDIQLPLPLPPPTRPTTPFGKSEFPDFAADLGRDCPPVEEIWDGYGSEVTDPCTRQAVETAVNYMWIGDAYWRQLAIRDGHAMADFLQQIDDIEDPYLKARLGFDSRWKGFTYTREVYWAGHFPGASMIHLEWYPSYADRPFTPEEQAAKTRFYRNLRDRGYNVPPEYLGDKQTLGNIGWSWAKALIVRTADGTWRMSYRAVCYRYHSLALEQRLLCPDDPNPHFPDSAWYDAGLHPPSHKFYYQDARNTEASAIHQDKVSHRRSGEYVGVPPS
ncbi:MAG: hypothetical protein OXM62_07235 [bacterium]|nr:hypothetical protein [bacterium]